MSGHIIKLSEISSKFEGVSAKVSVNLRHIDFAQTGGLVQNKKPVVGDVLLAKVMSIGDHQVMQSDNGRNIELYEGDKILLPYGNRYAVQQYEAFVPDDMQECHLASKGGLASLIVPENSTLQNPTVIKPIGILTDKDGKAMNMKDFSMNPQNINSKKRPVTIIIFGTGMDAGKTTCAAQMVRGITRAGHKVGFGKITGTGAFSDIYKPQDTGAIAVADFVDMGYPSTYKIGTQETLSILQGLTAYLSLRGADVNIIEVADGVFQSDNQALLKSEDFRSKIDGVFVAADSGLSAISAVRELHNHDIEVLAVGGLMTNTPLTTNEFTKHIGNAAPEFGVLDLADLEKAGTAKKILESIHDKYPDRPFITSPEPEQNIEENIEENIEHTLVAE
ncbi:MAG: DUF1611 domain-containing protein [Alphaproteobacteria bacterium]|nr:MAG: DUF1611 domain-containing protein [Alphaproteobacteria bacterium]